MRKYLKLSFTGCMPELASYLIDSVGFSFSCHEFIHLGVAIALRRRKSQLVPTINHISISASFVVHCQLNTNIDSEQVLEGGLPHSYCRHSYRSAFCLLCTSVLCESFCFACACVCESFDLSPNHSRCEVGKLISCACL